MRAPLEKLLHKNTEFRWSVKCQQSFDKIKEILSSPLSLTHFQPDQELFVALDGSSYGIGAVLFHRFSDGSEKPMAHASKSLTQAERNYSQIEREVLSIIFAVKKISSITLVREYPVNRSSAVGFYFWIKERYPSTCREPLTTLGSILDELYL